jgi:HK97 family phage major capsid protein
MKNKILTERLAARHSPMRIGLQFFGMKNLDAKLEEKNKILAKINEAVKSGDETAFTEAFTEFTDLLQNAVMEEARGMVAAADNTVLAGRGVRALTSTETAYYNKVLDAMRSKNPQQALTLIDETLPKTVIDAVFEDITEDHPLLDAIDFQNTGIITEWIVSSMDGRHKAVWGKLCDEIVEELLSGFDTIDLTQKKLSAFIPVCKAMLEVGPEWLDRYVRAILGEAIANGLEDGIIDGIGLDEPIGMLRNPAAPLDPVTGYPARAAVPITQITPATYGALIASLSVSPNNLVRKVKEVILVVNPVDYLTVVLPATSYRQPDGTWVSSFPFPTKVIQSVYVPLHSAIIGIGKRYFFGLGTGKGGKIEYSDHYHFLEDERVYLAKLYGNGRPLDSTSFITLDITNLVPVDPRVFVTNSRMDVDILNDPLNVDILNDPLNVLVNEDARLASLAIGALALSPAFNKSVHVYTAATTNETNTINAVAKDGEATIEILNGDTPVANGAAATWGEGANILTINVTNGVETETYTVTVTKS